MFARRSRGLEKRTENFRLFIVSGGTEILAKQKKAPTESSTGSKQEEVAAHDADLAPCRSPPASIAKSYAKPEASGARRTSPAHAEFQLLTQYLFEENA